MERSRSKPADTQVMVRERITHKSKLFTVFGRVLIQDLLANAGLGDYLACDSGFYDQAEDIPCSDKTILEMLIKWAREGKISAENLVELLNA